MPRTGHVVGLAAYLNTPRTAGSLTLEPKINSTQLPYSLVIDDDPDQQATIQIPAELATAFEAGDRVGVDITTTGTWTPTSADLQVSLLVRFSMED